MILAVIGYLADDRRPGIWPPPWPPHRDAADRDERAAAAVVEHLGIDEESYLELVAAAEELLATPAFQRLMSLISSALSEVEVLDGESVQILRRGNSGTSIRRSNVVQHLLAKATITDEGVFTAIAAADTVDREGEQIRPGAFTETIKRWRDAGRALPVHWNHAGEAANVIGSVDPALMHETSEGLYVEGELDLEDSDVAREAWRSMKAGRVALSFGYLVTSDRKRSDGVRELLGLDLFEISIVAAPANPDTRFLELKSAVRHAHGDRADDHLVSIFRGDSASPIRPATKGPPVPPELVGTAYDWKTSGEILPAKVIEAAVKSNRQVRLKALPVKIARFEV